jgi:tetratricopeptide (TPR) repeat protein
VFCRALPTQVVRSVTATLQSLGGQSKPASRGQLKTVQWSVGSFKTGQLGLYYAQGRYAEAQPLYERALAIYEEALGPDHPAVGTTLNNLAELYRAQGRYAEAQPLYERALAICEQALGPDHPRRCGDSKKLSSPGGKTSVVHDFSSSSYDLKSGEFLTLSVAPLLAAYGPQPTRG